jgi:hypothetical protein
MKPMIDKYKQYKQRSEVPQGSNVRHKRDLIAIEQTEK